MSLSRNLAEITEYRGVEGLVAAEILTDDDTSGYATGDVFAIAGVAEISKSVDSSNEAHYYDNLPAVVISSTSADDITIQASAIPLEVLAKITGQKYNSAIGAMIEGPRTPKYFALGYITKKTNGDLIYVWRYKGMFNIPGETNHTDDDSTDANGQELTFTGVATTHKFAQNDNKGAKSMYVDVSKGLADVSHFFDTVTTPDTLPAVTPATVYTVTNTLSHCSSNNTAASVVSGQPYAALISADADYTLGAVSVSMGGTDISSTAVSGGAITIPSVSGNLVITCTATPAA